MTRLRIAMTMRRAMGMGIAWSREARLSKDNVGIEEAYNSVSYLTRSTQSEILH